MSAVGGVSVVVAWLMEAGIHDFKFSVSYSNFSRFCGNNQGGCSGDGGRRQRKYVCSQCMPLTTLLTLLIHLSVVVHIFSHPVVVVVSSFVGCCFYSFCAFSCHCSASWNVVGIRHLRADGS